MFSENKLVKVQWPTAKTVAKLVYFAKPWFSLSVAGCTGTVVSCWLLGVFFAFAFAALPPEISSAMACSETTSIPGRAPATKGPCPVVIDSQNSLSMPFASPFIVSASDVSSSLVNSLLIEGNHHISSPGEKEWWCCRLDLFSVGIICNDDKQKQAWCPLHHLANLHHIDKARGNAGVRIRFLPYGQGTFSPARVFWHRLVQTWPCWLLKPFFPQSMPPLATRIAEGSKGMLERHPMIQTLYMSIKCLRLGLLKLFAILQP